MERKLSIGRRINFFRRLHKMTQKELGERLGFSEKTCDVRIAQYEAGDRIPKEELVKKMAAVFGISPQALLVPELNNWVQRMHSFFAMEDIYGAKICKIDEDYYLRIEEARAENETALGVRNAVLQEWVDKSDSLEQGKISQAEYDDWRYNYPRNGEYSHIVFRRDDIEECAPVPEAYMELVQLKKKLADEPEKRDFEELEKRYKRVEALIAKELADLRRAIEEAKDAK